MSLHRKLLIISSILILVGLAGTLPTFLYWTQSKVLASPKTILLPPNPKPSKHLITGKPVHIKIDNLNLSLDIQDGVYNQQSGEWTLSIDKAQFAVLSTQPNNEEGNTLIYGHYRPSVFSKLHTLKAGDLVDITTNNGYQFVYVYRSTYAVKPTDTSIFTYTGKPVLTLQTCSGAWFQNRQLYRFDLVSYKKI